jgi:hypothetical protein
VVAAVLVAGSEKAAAHRLGLPHSTVKHHLVNGRRNVGATTTQLAWIWPHGCPSPRAESTPPVAARRDRVLGRADPAVTAQGVRLSSVG